MRKHRKLTIGLVLMLALAIALPAGTALAGNYDEVTIKVKPQVIGVSIDLSEYDFEVQNVGATPSTTTTHFTVTNSSNIQTDQTVSVTSATWDGGDYDWTHSDTAEAGNQTVGLKANRGGEWATGDIIVKYSDPLYIYENCPSSTTEYGFGLKMLVPTIFSTSDTGTEKSNVVRITAASG